MILSMGYQARLFASAVFLGMTVGFVYDVIRVFRRIIPHSLGAIQTEDFFYWLLSGVFVFMAFLRENYGAVRPFLIMGLFLGIILYFASASKFIMSLSMAIIKIIKYILGIFLRVFKLLVEIIFTPVLLLLKIFRKPINFVKNKLKIFNKNNKKYLKNIKKCVIMFLYSLVKCVKIIFKKL